jgi:hypothetical protein
MCTQDGQEKRTYLPDSYLIFRLYPVQDLSANMNAAFLRSMINNPRLPSQSWYFIAATTLSILNRADEVPKVFRYAINNISRPNEEDGHAGQLKIARRMREALIKAAAIGGLPKVLKAMKLALIPALYVYGTMCLTMSINRLLMLSWH